MWEATAKDEVQVTKNGVGLWLAAGSELVFEEFRAEQDKNRDGASFREEERGRSTLRARLSRGEVAMAVPRLGSESTMVFRTAHAAITILGGRVILRTDEVATSIAVVRGSVSVGQDGRASPWTLRDQQQLVLRTGGMAESPPVVVAIAEQEMSALNAKISRIPEGPTTHEIADSRAPDADGRAKRAGLETVEPGFDGAWWLGLIGLVAVMFFNRARRRSMILWGGLPVYIVSSFFLTLLGFFASDGDLLLFLGILAVVLLLLTAPTLPLWRWPRAGMRIPGKLIHGTVQGLFGGALVGLLFTGTLYLVNRVEGPGGEELGQAILWAMKRWFGVGWLWPLTAGSLSVTEGLGLLVAGVATVALTVDNFRQLWRDDERAAAVGIAKRNERLALTSVAGFLLYALCQTDLATRGGDGRDCAAAALLAAVLGFVSTWPLLRTEERFPGRAGKTGGDRRRKSETLLSSATTLTNMALAVAAVSAYTGWEYTGNLVSLLDIRDAFASDYLRLQLDALPNTKEAIERARTARDSPVFIDLQSNDRILVILQSEISNLDSPGGESGRAGAIATWTSWVKAQVSKPRGTIPDLARFGPEAPPSFSLTVHERGRQQPWVARAVVQLPLETPEAPSATVAAIESAGLADFEPEAATTLEGVTAVFRKAEAQILNRKMSLPVVDMEVPATTGPVAAFLIVCGLLRFFSERARLLRQSAPTGEWRAEWIMMDAREPFTKVMVWSWRAVLFLAPWVLLGEAVRGFNLSRYVWAGGSSPWGDLALVTGIVLMLHFAVGTSRRVVQAFIDLSPHLDEKERQASTMTQCGERS